MTKLKILSESKKITGLILDLRDNPGGMLEQAVSVASIFINKGTIVQVSSPILGENVHYECLQDVPFKLDSKVPVVVLINRGTASAAEVVAGALRDHKRAIIMGKKSFGKGSVQEFIQMDDGSALSITTALYYTPSGRSIEKVGLIPDIVVVKGREPTKQMNTFRGMRDIIKAANGIMNKEAR
jgi:carboxyl-terminal processing protease